MIVMTDGLRTLAGDAMRSALMRFTKSPTSGAITGAVATAILQSSSATTVAAVGFVGAGLMNFSQALGIVFGANVGTTLRGWIIVLLGFKLQFGLIMMPLVLIGSILRLFTRGRLAHTGFALAGFSLIFVGIDLMQQGMAGLQGVVTPDDFPPDTIIGRLQLVASGILITLVTQSSSAGVAASLTALYAGAINFNQAAALVIGMDVGTTVTAVMASLGGTVGSRRTGLSHVVYNLLTGIGALLFLTPYTLFWEWLAPGELIRNAELALVGFHTLYNILGVLIILPFARPFARMIETLIPEQAPIYTHGLEIKLLKEPGIAITAAHAAIKDELLALLNYAKAQLAGTGLDREVNLQELQAALDQTHDYIDQIHLTVESGPDWSRLLAIIHCLDHMQRLHERCEEDADRAATARRLETLSGVGHDIRIAIDEISYALASNQYAQALSLAEQNLKMINNQAEPLREIFMHHVATGKMNVREATDALEAIRWLLRVSAHVSRIAFHLQQAQQSAHKA
ncbi:MAG: Na/Pi cotransporter family protein [Gammaproteobacteria bacterium]|nr:MAG: Na/Pi cotransporter family protein [Gammaproteobacteria bacterium]